MKWRGEAASRAKARGCQKGDGEGVRPQAELRLGVVKGMSGRVRPQAELSCQESDGEG